MASSSQFLASHKAEVSSLVQTKLCDQNILAFKSGGELRILLPELVRYLMGEQCRSIIDVDLQVRKLHISLYQCSDAQFKLLKRQGLLPLTTTCEQIHLIRKSDAERLCSVLLSDQLHRDAGRNSLLKHCCTPTCLAVQHECFGKTRGIFHTSRYVKADSACVSCCECDATFTTTQFVSHSHKTPEKMVAHWGFDSARWRSYMLLCRFQENYAQSRELLSTVKKKFEPVDSVKVEPKQLALEQIPGYSQFVSGVASLPSAHLRQLQLFSSLLSGAPPQLPGRVSQILNYSNSAAPNVRLAAGGPSAFTVPSNLVRAQQDRSSTEDVTPEKKTRLEAESTSSLKPAAASTSSPALMSPPTVTQKPTPISAADQLKSMLERQLVTELDLVRRNVSAEVWPDVQTLLTDARCNNIPALLDMYRKVVREGWEAEVSQKSDSSALAEDLKESNSRLQQSLHRRDKQLKANAIKLSELEEQLERQTQQATVEKEALELALRRALQQTPAAPETTCDELLQQKNGSEQRVPNRKPV